MLPTFKQQLNLKSLGFDNVLRWKETKFIIKVSWLRLTVKETNQDVMKKAWSKSFQMKNKKAFRWKIKKLSDEK